MSNDNIWVTGDNRIDLSKLTRIYPAVLIRAGGESASVSLEWAELKADKIEIEAYILVCDIDPVGEVPLNRIEVHFSTKEALLEEMQLIAQRLSVRAEG